jgi:quinol monooxygenase YgiN
METKRINVVVKIMPILGKERELRKRMAYVAQETQKEAGCIFYNLFEGDKDNSSLYFLGEWADQSSLDAHDLTQHVKDFRNDQPILAGEISVTSLFKI